MSVQSMIILGKHSITLTPEAIDIWWKLASGFVTKGREQIEAFHQFRIPDSQEEVVRIKGLELQIKRVEELLIQIELLKGHASRIFDQDFYSWAEVFRKTRILAGLARSQDDAVLNLAVLLAIETLKLGNPRFNETKFINYINN